MAQLESMGRSNKVIEGPVTLSGVGDKKTLNTAYLTSTFLYMMAEVQVYVVYVYKK